MRRKIRHLFFLVLLEVEYREVLGGMYVYAAR